MSWRLFSEVVKVSNANVWADARVEWEMKKSYLREGSECLCGKYPITKICILVNKINKNEIEVGRCCVKKFKMDLHTEYDVLQRVKRDESKSLNAAILEVAKKREVVNEWEYEFYEDTLRKRKMTEKQLEKRKQINKKVIDVFCR